MASEVLQDDGECGSQGGLPPDQEMLADLHEYREGERMEIPAVGA